MSTHTSFETLEIADLQHVVGGVTADQWSSITQQASSYCPQTVAKYQGVNPQTLTRSKAQQMGNSCLKEMGPGMARVAKGPIDSAIDQAFPR